MPRKEVSGFCINLGRLHLSSPPSSPQVPTFVNLHLFNQYMRILRRTISNPGLAISYEASFAATCAHVLDPPHALALQFLIFLQGTAFLIYDGLTDPQHHEAPVVAGSGTWLEAALICFFGIAFLLLVGFIYGMSQETMLRSDHQLRARALALHAATERIVRNFLPAPVVDAVNKQSADGVADIVAWSFNPACLLQSDIVGFTALGSRISPEDLCGCGLPFHSRYIYLFYAGAGNSPPPRAAFKKTEYDRLSLPIPSTH